MVQCVAIDCFNKSEDGVQMYYFPQDKIRRSFWIKNVGRKNWLPEGLSALCEYHFTSDMWENPDSLLIGKRKLHDRAIPTIFGQDVVQVSSTKKFIKISKNGIINGACFNQFEDEDFLDQNNEFNENLYSEIDVKMEVIQPVVQPPSQDKIINSLHGSALLQKMVASTSSAPISVIIENTDKDEKIGRLKLKNIHGTATVRIKDKACAEEYIIPEHEIFEKDPLAISEIDIFSNFPSKNTVKITESNSKNTKKTVLPSVKSNLVKNSTIVPNPKIPENSTEEEKVILSMKRAYKQMDVNICGLKAKLEAAEKLFTYSETLRTKMKKAFREKERRWELKMSGMNGKNKKPNILKKINKL